MQRDRKTRSVQAKKTLVRGTSLDALVSRIRSILTEARTDVVRTVNSQMVRAYWLIGREIVEDEQQGKHRAGYGESLVENLSTRLIQDYGKGFTPTNLKYMRLFYLTYPDPLTKETRHAAHDESRARSVPENIRHAVRDQFEVSGSFNENLSWTHYRLLTKVESIEARSFYEIETVKNRWSSRELERQINSLLFERLAKSRDKKGVLALATRGHEIQKPEDTIKDPVVLEFLGLPESEKLVESELEQALLDNLKKFLLELGKGFAFVDRQQRLTLDGDHFYVDLVFYHTILKCHVLIDLKVQKLTHADLGQMQLYVNYYDEWRRTTGDNPTIGLILCTDKNDAVVKYTLGKGNRQIFASKYKLYLPTEKELAEEIKRELENVKQSE
jgi:predicted nuclease of restriction endonuclease-like (RecB) superfamily